jgi:hypothetical protein
VDDDFYYDPAADPMAQAEELMEEAIFDNFDDDVILENISSQEIVD